MAKAEEMLKGEMKMFLFFSTLFKFLYRSKAKRLLASATVGVLFSAPQTRVRNRKQTGAIPHPKKLVRRAINPPEVYSDTAARPQLKSPARVYLGLITKAPFLSIKPHLPFAQTAATPSWKP